MIMELADETPHAYVPFLPAVKSSQPHGNVMFPESTGMLVPEV